MASVVVSRRWHDPTRKKLGQEGYDAAEASQEQKGPTPRFRAHEYKKKDIQRRR